MVKIEEINNQNPWWKYGVNYGSYDVDMTRYRNQRVMVKRDRVEVGKGSICIIRGCRQVGKTTYMKWFTSRALSDGIGPRRIIYLAVDRFFASRRELRRALVNYFLKRNRDADEVYILLDEVTCLKDWHLELKYLYDSGRVQKARVLVTGSSGEALRRVAEQLPGRGLEGNEYYLKPLSFREFIFQTGEFFVSHTESSDLRDSLSLLKEKLRKVKVTLEEEVDEVASMVNEILPFKTELEYLFGHYLSCGGFPVAINQYVKSLPSHRDRLMFKPDLVEQFVRTILGEISKYGKNEMLARRILKAIIDRYGNRFSYTKLAHDVDMSHITASDYLDFLEQSFVLSVIYSYDPSRRELRYKANKKVYFQDPIILYSLKSFLSGRDVNEIIEETTENEELLGKVVESIASSHLSMSFEIPYMREVNTFLWYYYGSKGKELDFVLRNKDIYWGVEVKYQNDVGVGDVLRIPGIRKYIILSKEDYVETENTLVVPAEVLLPLLEKSKRVL